MKSISKMLLTISAISFSTFVLDAALPKLEDQAFPKSKYSFLDKCSADNGKINWTIVGQLERMDQGTFNVDAYVTSKVLPCLDPNKNKGYVGNIKASCSTAQGSNNQVKVCNAVGINLQPNPSTALQPVRTVKIADADIAKLLDKAVPKTFLTCTKDSGNINWPVIKQLETDALNPSTAATQMASVFKDRIDRCMDNKKNPNFMRAVEETCKLSVGSAKQLSTCQTVQRLTGRPNPVASGSDVNSLTAKVNSIATEAQSMQQDNSGLQAKLDESMSKITDLQGQVDGANASNADLQGKLDAANASIAELQGKIASVTNDDDADKAKITELQGQVDAATASNTDLQAKLDAANAKITDLQGQVDAANASNADLQGKLDAANASIAELQGKLDEMQKQYGDLDAYKAQLSTFATSLAAYQQQIQDWATQMNDYFAQKQQMLDAATSAQN
jgi:peptidoglycan hydrolase CwlO-like protein